MGSHGQCCGHPTQESTEAAPPQNQTLRRELFALGLTLVLWVVGLIFQPALRNTPAAIGEYGIFLAAYVISGGSVLISALRNLYRGQIFDENFLMSIATLGAIAIHELPEAVAVMLFFNLGEFFQASAVQRSRGSIQSLLQIRPDTAHRLGSDGQLETVHPNRSRLAIGSGSNLGSWWPSSEMVLTMPRCWRGLM